MFTTLLSAIIPALIPTFADGVRGVFNKFTGGAGAAPANAQEAVMVMEADTKRLEALAKLDSVGKVHMWVNDVRGMMRPAVAIAIVVAYVVSLFAELPEALALQVAEFTRIVVFYLFGERTLMHISRQK